MCECKVYPISCMQDRNISTPICLPNVCAQKGSEVLWKHCCLQRFSNLELPTKLALYEVNIWQVRNISVPTTQRAFAFRFWHSFPVNTSLTKFLKTMAFMTTITTDQKTKGERFQ